MTLIRILTIIFVAFAGSRAILRFRDKAISIGELTLWSTIWTIILLIVFRPDIADQTATIFGIQRGTDVMFFSAIVLMFYLIFRLYVKLDILDRHITELAANTSKELHKMNKHSDSI